MRNWLTKNRAIKFAIAGMLAGMAAFLSEQIELAKLVEILFLGFTAIFLRKGMAPERNE